jgi:hypothetical protein
MHDFAQKIVCVCGLCTFYILIQKADVLRKLFKSQWTRGVVVFNTFFFLSSVLFGGEEVGIKESGTICIFHQSGKGQERNREETENGILE